MDQARRSGVKQIGFSEHDEWAQRVKPHLLKRLGDQNQDITVRLGIEMDYLPELAQNHREILKGKFDFVIGSVHYIDGWPFDHPDYKHKFAEVDLDQAYRRYYNLVQEMVETGWYDVVGHLDVVKIWGHRAPRDGVHYTEAILSSVKSVGMVIEINSAGLRKPVKELYPEEAIIKRIYNCNIPVTIGSDAHHPEQVGENLAHVVELLKRIGFRKITGFNQRRHEYIAI